MNIEFVDTQEQTFGEDAMVELTELQLALIGGGIGETTLGTGR